MHKANFLPFFIVFFSLSLVLILLGKSGILNGFTSLVNSATFPVKSATLDIFGFENKNVKKLAEENAKLRKQALENKNLSLENKALKDQFASSISNTQSLIPARVVGNPGFIPGVSLPEYLIIDKGSRDHVVLGDAVVIEKYLVGRVINITNNFSKVELLIHKDATFTGKVASYDGREVSGIIKGKGNEKLSFENVLLTLELKKEDLVLTKGERDETGIGFPPDLIVGKVVSVEKKSADLFQKAEVVSFVDFVSLRTVFVMK